MSTFKNREQQFPDDELFLMEELNSTLSQHSSSNSSSSDSQSIDSVETTKFLENHGPGPPPVGVIFTSSSNSFVLNHNSPKIELKHNQIVLQDGDGGGGAGKQQYAPSNFVARNIEVKTTSNNFNPKTGPDIGTTSCGSSLITLRRTITANCIRF